MSENTVDKLIFLLYIFIQSIFNYNYRLNKILLKTRTVSMVYSVHFTLKI